MKPPRYIRNNLIIGAMLFALALLVMFVRWIAS